MPSGHTTPPAMPIDVHGLNAASAALMARTSRLVGWGSGSVFDYFHGLYPVRLEYLVDNDPTRHGKSSRGVEIVSPDRLSRESRETTFVLI
jgi:hypothetical protein